MELPQGFNLRALRVFVMVADAGSMTKAARNLRITQSSVSETVAMLEEALETDLFDRHVRPIKLTHSGTRLYQKSYTLLQNAADTFNSVRNTSAIGLPRLTLAMVESTADILGPVLVRRVNHVAAQWRVWTGNSLDNHAALLNHSADIIITASDELDDTDELDRFPLVRENFVIMVPRSWGIEKPDLTELANRPFIRFSRRSAIGQQVERQTNRLRMKLPFHAEFDTIGGVQSTVSAGQGWTFSTPLCLMNDVASFDALTVLPYRRAQFSRRVTLIGRKGMIGDAPATLAKVARAALRDLIDKELSPRWPTIIDEIQIF